MKRGPASRITVASPAADAEIPLQNCLTDVNFHQSQSLYLLSDEFQRNGNEKAIVMRKLLPFSPSIKPDLNSDHRYEEKSPNPENTGESSSLRKE